MKVKDLIAGMEGRAMDAQFQKDICALYETKDYGDTEPDCQTGYAKLLPLLTEEQKMSLVQMEQAYIRRRNYAAQYGFKCGIFGAFRQYFGYSKANDGGFDDLVFQDFLMQPGMQRHHENYANIELCNEIDRARETPALISCCSFTKSDGTDLPQIFKRKTAILIQVMDLVLDDFHDKAHVLFNHTLLLRS